MSYLITGGTGFIGRHLARELVNQGEKVCVVSRRPKVEIFSDIKEKITIASANVLDVTDLLHIIKEHNVEYIVHLAALLIPESQKNPKKAVEVNCVGTNNIFEIARIADIKRVVWASSIAVYGPADYYDHPVNEEDAVKPTTVYGACKVLNEFMGEYYYQTYGVDNIGLRFTVVYGPGRAAGASAFASELIEKPALGQPVKVSWGDQKINWQYVKDAVKSILLALKVKSVKHRVFNTGGPVRTVREVANYIKQLIPTAKIEVEPGELGWIADIDITRAKEELGYEPSYTIEKGIREHINTLRAKAGLPLV